MNKTEMKRDIKDPYYREMLAFLAEKWAWAGIDGFKDECRIAIYEFAVRHHGGQYSNLYAAQCQTGYSPNMHCFDPENPSDEDQITFDLYDSLVDAYAPPAQLYCCACGGELERVTDTCIPLSPAWDEKQDLCDGCFEQLQNVQNYLNQYIVESNEHVNHESFSSRTCQLCGPGLAGERYICGVVVRDKRTNKIYGLYYCSVCVDCAEKHDDY